MLKELGSLFWTPWLIKMCGSNSKEAAIDVIAIHVNHPEAKVSPAELRESAISWCAELVLLQGAGSFTLGRALGVLLNGYMNTCTFSSPGWRETQKRTKATPSYGSTPKNIMVG